MSGFVFSKKPIEIESGSGVHVTDPSGTEYLDMGASYACTPLGHSHPAVVEALAEQAEELTYIQGSYPVAVRSELQDTLESVAPDGLQNGWLSNSGTEANEAALKFARHATGRSKVIAMTGAFHGRTMGSLAATWKRKYRDGFEPLAGAVEFVESGDVEALREAVDEDTAAVIMEPIQGEGGIEAAGSAMLQAAREETSGVGAALIFDEIQTGLGRTGKMWASQHWDVEPDILTSAKGLANGLPIGATLVRDWIAENPGDHGSTFSGGPAIAAAANTTLQTIQAEKLPARAAELGEALIEELEHEVGEEVREIRGRGLMVGIEVKRGANRAVRKLAMDEQILTLPAGRTVLRLLPPLIVERSHVDRTVEAIGRVLGDGTDS